MGILGHVDAGKTTLCKALSSIASTAAFDKNPQSQERGITLDLGFSAMTINENLQVTFVDCPGHASLIRTIIGGAQIINFMILVVDVTKGLQAQTLECIVIAQITCPQMIIVLNKIDKLPKDRRDTIVQRMSEKFRKTFAEKGIEIVAIVPVSALEQENLNSLRAAVVEFLSILPEITENVNERPLLFSVDHCFTIRGKGTICTGTVLDGVMNVGDMLEIPQLGNCHRQVKSIEMFRKPLQQARKGDRLGVCITQFDASQLERGLLCAPGSISKCQIAVIECNPVDLYKGTIRSKTKYHVSVGHATVLATITLFKGETSNSSFVSGSLYEYVDEIDGKDTTLKYFVMLDFEKPILWTPNCLLICSRLDLEQGGSQITTTHQPPACRIAFYGTIVAGSGAGDKTSFLRGVKMFARKSKTGSIQRVVNEREIIVEDFFRKISNRDVFVGLRVHLSSGQTGRIEGTFGKASKVKITLDESLTEDNLSRPKEIAVFLKFKKLLFAENKQIFQ